MHIAYEGYSTGVVEVGTFSASPFRYFYLTYNAYLLKYLFKFYVSKFSKKIIIFHNIPLNF